MPYPDIQGTNNKVLNVNFTVTNNSGEAGTKDIELRISGLHGASFGGSNPVTQDTTDNLDIGDTQRMALAWDGGNENPGYYEVKVKAGSGDDTETIVAELCYEDSMYLIGGSNTDGTKNTVQWWDEDDWKSRSADTLNTAVSKHVAVMYKGTIWVLGGETSSGITTKTVQQWDGPSNGWTNGTDMPKTAKNAAGAVHNGNVFVIGGKKNDNSNLVQRYDGSSWEHSDDGGTLQDTSPAGNAGNSPVAQVYNGTLYVANSNGVVMKFLGYGSGWTDLDNSLEVGVSEANSAVYDGDWYVFGGTDGTNRRSDVQRFLGEGNGWVQDSTNGSGSFPELNYDVKRASVAVHDGSVYIIGGNTSSGNTAAVQKWDTNGCTTLSGAETLPYQIENAASVGVSGM